MAHNIGTKLFKFSSQQLVTPTRFSTLPHRYSLNNFELIITEFPGAMWPTSVRKHLNKIVDKTATQNLRRS